MNISAGYELYHKKPSPEPKSAVKNTEISAELSALPEKIPFYEKFGFETVNGRAMIKSPGH